MKLTTLTIAGLLFAGSLHAQQITAYDLELSNADLLKPQIENRLTIQRHREEERVKAEEKRVKAEKEREYQRYLAEAYFNVSRASAQTARQDPFEEVDAAIRKSQEARARRTQEAILQELQDQTQILREARDCERPFNNRGRW